MYTSSSQGPVVTLYPHSSAMIFSRDLPPPPSAAVSPRIASPPPDTRSLFDKLVDHINLLREMHLALHQEIEERRYRADREIQMLKLSVEQAPPPSAPPSPQKATLQAPLVRFYIEQIGKLPQEELRQKTKLDRSLMYQINQVNAALKAELAKTETAFNADQDLRKRGLDARIKNDFKGYETEANKTTIQKIRDDLGAFERESRDKIQACTQIHREISQVVIKNSVFYQT